MEELTPLPVMNPTTSEWSGCPTVTAESGQGMARDRSNGGEYSPVSSVASLKCHHVIDHVEPPDSETRLMFQAVIRRAILQSRHHIQDQCGTAAVPVESLWILPSTSLGCLAYRRVGNA